jgi:broad specificity phosphatase PhoE
MKRLRNFLDRISKEREEDKTILIVAHGITNKVIISHLVQLRLGKQLLRFSQENTCMNILTWKKEFNNWNINCINDIEHLPTNLRSSKSLR